jgi:hypothetical protein
MKEARPSCDIETQDVSRLGVRHLHSNSTYIHPSSAPVYLHNVGGHGKQVTIPYS